MTGARYPATLADHAAPRSLAALHVELLNRFRALPLDNPERGRLATRIREVEAEIDARIGT